MLYLTTIQTERTEVLAPCVMLLLLRQSDDGDAGEAVPRVPLRRGCARPRRGSSGASCSGCGAQPRDLVDTGLYAIHAASDVKRVVKC
jgi:hypothetical protein